MNETRIDYKKAWEGMSEYKRYECVRQVQERELQTKVVVSFDYGMYIVRDCIDKWSKDRDAYMWQLEKMTKKIKDGDNWLIINNYDPIRGKLMETYTKFESAWSMDEVLEELGYTPEEILYNASSYGQDLWRWLEDQYSVSE